MLCTILDNQPCPTQSEKDIRSFYQGEVTHFNTIWWNETFLIGCLVKTTHFVTFIHKQSKPYDMPFHNAWTVVNVDSKCPKHHEHNGAFTNFHMCKILQKFASMQESNTISVFLKEQWWYRMFSVNCSILSLAISFPPITMLTGSSKSQRLESAKRWSELMFECFEKYQLMTYTSTP